MSVEGSELRVERICLGQGYGGQGSGRAGEHGRSEVKEQAAAGKDEVRGSQGMLPQKVLTVNNCLLASDSN